MRRGVGVRGKARRAPTSRLMEHPAIPNGSLWECSSRKKPAPARACGSVHAGYVRGPPTRVTSTAGGGAVSMGRCRPSHHGQPRTTRGVVDPPTTSLRQPQFYKTPRALE